MIRKLDNLGRILIPVEYRNILGIKANVPLNILIDRDKLIISKHENSCIICGSIDCIHNVGGVHICSDCIESISIHFKKQKYET